jgi:group I intron endonuclease
MGYIYKIRNLVNNKYYIGQTTQELEERWRQHKQKNSNCRYLKHAFNKYGFDKFKFELICKCIDEDLDILEIKYMEEYKSLVPNGYNLREGGNGGRQHQSTKDKISKTLLDRNYKYPIGMHPWIGRNHREETKDKIKKSLLGKKASDETIEKMKLIGRKKVIQYDLNGNIINVYESGKEAAEKNDTTKAGVSMVCNGKRIQLKGFKYKYQDDNISDILNEIKNLKI